MGLISSERFVSNKQLTQHDFEQLAERLSLRPRHARKIGLIVARRATAPERVATRWNGSETTNVAQPGDWTVTNLSAQLEPLRDRDGHPNTYVITSARFPELYELATIETAFGPAYRARSVVLALKLPAGFDIIAPWGERQQAPSGYLISNGHEVYGNNTETFEASYEILPDQ